MVMGNGMGCMMEMGIRKDSYEIKELLKRYIVENSRRKKICVCVYG